MSCESTFSFSFDLGFYKKNPHLLIFTISLKNINPYITDKKIKSELKPKKEEYIEKVADFEVIDIE